MKPGPQRTLTDDNVLDAAFQLLGAKGFGELSIRGVASILGVAPGGIYTYFPSKTALLKAMVERLYGNLDLTAALTESLPWDDRMRALALAVRDQLGHIYGAVGLIMAGPLDGPRTLAFNETLLTLFLEAGLALDDAARASYAFQVYVLGSISLESADRDPTHPEQTEAEQVAARMSALEHFDVGAFPLTAQTGDVVARHNTTEQFLWGLDRLIAGVAQPR